MEGPVFNNLPPARRPAGDYEWDKYAWLAKQNPGKAVLAAEHVPISRIKSVRTYSQPPFVTTDGHIVVSMRDSHVEDDGIRYGNVWFTWNSTQKEN